MNARSNPFGLQKTNPDPYQEVGKALRDEVERESEALQLLRSLGWQCFKPKG